MLRIAFAAAEFAPLVKTGGLADVAAGLTRFLATVEADQRIFLPAYDTLDDHGEDRTVCDFARDVPITLGGRTLSFTLQRMRVPGCMHDIHLVDCPALYHRGGLYTSDDDEHVRWAYFCRAIVASCQRMAFAPDIVHCNDWHTGLLPLYLRSVDAWDELFARTKSLLTIHNLGYQGVFPADRVGDLGLQEFTWQLHQDHLRDGYVNYLETGILHAHWLSTVSRTYAREIMTPPFGHGLDGILRMRGDHLAGIVNGVDEGTWNPAHDPAIAANYTADDLSGKRTCRADLLKKLGLAPDPRAPVFGMVTRLTGQKGIDTLYEALPELLSAHDVRVAVLGSGEERFESFFHSLQQRFPGKACFYRGYNDGLAHVIEAGSDVFLMPSHFEPCGLNQMYSMRYGTPPVVHKTGGLADTVTHHAPGSDTGTGFVFEVGDSAGATWAIGQALQAWGHRGAWERLMKRGMQQDWSWDRQGREYLLLYDRMMAEQVTAT